MIFYQVCNIDIKRNIYTYRYYQLFCRCLVIIYINLGIFVCDCVLVSRLTSE